MQWVIIDSKVYNLSRFKDLHPGGVAVLLDEEIGTYQLTWHMQRHESHISYLLYLPAGQDATEAFFGLHRHEVLLRPQYQRLQIGVIVDDEEQIPPRIAGSLSQVPYAEPTWLSDGFHSPYYKEVRSHLQTEI